MSNRLKSHQHNGRIARAATMWITMWITATAFAGAATADTAGDSPKLSDDPPGIPGGGGGAGGASAAPKAGTANAANIAKKQANLDFYASSTHDEYNRCNLTELAYPGQHRVPIATRWWYSGLQANQMVNACVRVALRSATSTVGNYSVSVLSPAGSGVSMVPSSAAFGGNLPPSPHWTGNTWPLGKYFSPEICTSAPINKSVVSTPSQLRLVLLKGNAQKGSCEIFFGSNPRTPSRITNNVVQTN